MPGEGEACSVQVCKVVFYFRNFGPVAGDGCQKVEDVVKVLDEKAEKTVVRGGPEMRE